LKNEFQNALVVKTKISPLKEMHTIIMSSL